MMEMLMEMLPMMYPQGLSPKAKMAIMQQLKLNGQLGISPGEVPGSLHDAMMAVAPGMKTMPGAVEPGETPQMMVDTMLAGWRRRYGAMPDVPPFDMSVEPTLPPASVARR
jgi:hypothetical protein